MTDGTPEATSAGQFAARSRDLLGRIRALSATRQAAEEDLARTRREKLARAEEERTTRKTRLAEDLEHATVDAERTYRKEAKRIKKTAAAESERIERAREDEKHNILVKADRNEREARKKLDEAIWATETVFEANEDRPDEEYGKARRTTTGRRKGLERVAADAVALLARYRMKGLARTASAGGEGTITPEGAASDDDSETAGNPAAALDRATTAANTELDRLSRLWSAWLFREARLFFIVLLVGVGAGAIAAWQRQWQFDQFVGIVAGGAVLGCLVLAIGLYALARRQAAAIHARLGRAVDEGIRACAACTDAAAAERDRAKAEMVRVRDEEIRTARETYEPILEEMSNRRRVHVERIEQTYPARLEEIGAQRQRDLKELESQFVARKAQLEERHDHELAETEATYKKTIEDTEADHARAWEEMERTWKDGMARAQTDLAAITAEHAALFPAWDDARWQEWAPPADFAPSIPFGTLAVDLGEVPGGIPEDERLAVPIPRQFELPATVDFPGHCSLLLVSDNEGRPEAVGTLQTVMLRLLTAMPPGKVRFTILDPVGLGQNFAGFMHLADYEEAFVTSRIWTEARHIEQRLGDLSEHMETVIQKYLRNEFETIASYNEHAGEIAEPYRFLVICDFPTNFTEIAVRRLTSIVSSGARCGVHTLISLDTREDTPKGIDRADLEAHASTLIHENGAFRWKDPVLGDLPLTLQKPPDEAFVTRKLRLVGEAAGDATRVEVPFDVIAPDEHGLWTGDCRRTLAVPLGRAAATKLQQLEIGAGTSQHALIAGKTGSGKSTLLHVIITNLALWYSPDEVQFYLVDFKKGVEFKTYATNDLPHARAVAVESDREFGLSVLQRIDAEMKERGDRFRELGVQDIAGYRRLDRGPMPRILLVVDEFQEMFVEDDKLGQDAALLLDRLVRQGRAFGIHVLLGSQTLGGAYTLARSTMGQMQVRIALQCSEADSYLIMSDDNAAARLLGRPGEAIYNDAGGAIEGNSPFQICWLPDAERDEQLARVAGLARERGWRRPEPQIVFEGNVPADVRSNHLLEELLTTPGAPGPDGRPRAPQAWLGEAIAIKGPTAGVLRRHSGNNLLIVGQQEEEAIAMTATAMVSLAAHTPPPGGNGSSPGGATFYVLDGTPLDSPNAGYLDRVGAALPYDVRSVKWRDVEAAIDEIARELARRQAADLPDTPPIYLVICGLQRFRMLRASDDFGFSSASDDAPPAAEKQFGDILRDGAPLGIHVVTWCDTATNLNRTLDRSGLREFEMRVLFQMGSADSTQLIDAPNASKLGIRRALYHNEEEGVLEKFRPYALPDDTWLESVRERLTRAAGARA